MRVKVLKVILYICGIFCIVYPIYSKFLSFKNQTEIISNYNKEIETMDKEILEDKLKKSEEFNDENASQIKVVDPNEINVDDASSSYSFLELGEMVGTINIPKINVEYPIIDGETDSVEETEALLKISPTKFWGPEPNEVGNFCIVGHNYRNSRFFSKVPTLENGDIIKITDLAGQTINYRVYNKYEVDPTDVSCTTQLTNGNKEITLITCTNDSKMRVIVKAREV